MPLASLSTCLAFALLLQQRDADRGGREKNLGCLTHIFNGAAVKYASEDREAMSAGLESLEPQKLKSEDWLPTQVRIRPAGIVKVHPRIELL